MIRKTKNLECYIDDFDEIKAYHSKNFFEGKSNHFHLKDSKGKIIPLELQEKVDEGSHYMYKLRPLAPIEIGERYFYYDEHCRPARVHYSHIVKTVRFHEGYSFPDGTPGIHYSPEKTTFSLWAPTAHGVAIVYTKDGERMIRHLKRQEKGMWSLELEGDFLHVPYTYLVDVNGVVNRAVDPYNPFIGVNTTFSFVDDLSLLDLPEKVEMEKLESPVDAVIYEASIRDLTSQIPLEIEHARTFKGFTEESRKTKERKHGFSYLKDLGITHVQLLPVLDFGSTDEEYPTFYYNWGYDPNHFRALEGSYSTDPFDPRKRIEEFAWMVHDLHQAGIRVVLDVVFNHVYNKDYFPLDQVVPDYYFLMNRNGEYSNGSFCGNDIDSRPEMAARYLIDTCKFLVETYDVDGLRFDLMGILDTKLLNEIEKECRKIKPDFMIYGEGWNMPSYVPEEMRASMNNMDKMPGIGHFSDRFRETVRGSNGDLKEKGFSLGNSSRMDDAIQVMKASVAENKFDTPEKVINYIECHDNHTMWDKIEVANEGESEEMKLRHQIMGIAMVLLSQGIPFLHSGQEFARTKRGFGNTYNKEDFFNLIDYHRRDKNQHLVDQTKELIRIRKEHPSLRLRTKDEILNQVQAYSQDGLLVYKTQKDKDQIIALFNPTDQTRYFQLDGDYTVLFNAAGQSNQQARQAELPGYSTMVLSRN